MNEIRAPGLLSGEADDQSRGIGQGEARLHRCPSRLQRPPLAERTEQREDAAKEALDAGAFAQLLCRPAPVPSRSAAGRCGSSGAWGSKAPRPRHRARCGSRQSGASSSIRHRDARCAGVGRRGAAPVLKADGQTERRGHWPERGGRARAGRSHGLISCTRGTSLAERSAYHFARVTKRPRHLINRDGVG
jgi:hypothetical protein